MLPKLSDPVRGPWSDRSDRGLWSLLGASDRSLWIVVCLADLDPWPLVYWLGHGSGDLDLLARIVILAQVARYGLGLGVLEPFQFRSMSDPLVRIGLMDWSCSSTGDPILAQFGVLAPGCLSLGSSCGMVLLLGTCVFESWVRAASQ